MRARSELQKEAVMEDSQNKAHIRHILVVDDEEEYRILTDQFLRRIGYISHTAAGASEAMETLRTQPVDLVLSDIQMGEKNGIQLMREARQVYPHLDFIIMTGHAQDYSYRNIIAAGATDFISKPFEMEKLQSKLERIEREKGLLRQLEKANEQLQDANRSLAWEARSNASFAALAEALLASSSIEEMSGLTLKYATELTESPLGFVGYVDQETGHLVSPTMVGDIWDKWLISNKDNILEKSSGLWDWTLQNRKPLLTNAPQSDPRSSGIPEGHIPIQRFLSAPAAIGEVILGQICVANSLRDYGEKDLILVVRLAMIFALAVQRMWIQKELEQARDYLENVFDNAAEAVGIVDARGRFSKWNRGAETLYGFTFDELKGKPFYDLYPDKEVLGKMLAQLRRNGYVSGYEISCRRKDGQIIPLRISVRLLKDCEGKVTGSVAVAMDLTDLKESLEELELTNRKLQSEIFERERISEELREARDQLEKLVIERTEKLSKAGDLLKRSLDRFKEISEET
jgi:PAS domain S-box-containing protein